MSTRTNNGLLHKEADHGTAPAKNGTLGVQRPLSSEFSNCGNPSASQCDGTVAATRTAPLCTREVFRRGDCQRNLRATVLFSLSHSLTWTVTMSHRLQNLLRLGTRPLAAKETLIRSTGLRWTSRPATGAGKCEGRTTTVGTFDNSKDAFRSKTTTELLRALIVFRMCAVDTLVFYQGKVSHNETMRSDLLLIIIIIILIKINN